jgi:hypothetical protein
MRGLDPRIHLPLKKSLADGLPGQAGNDTPRVALALALVVAGMLSACSDIYFGDRRETLRSAPTITSPPIGSRR